MRTRLPVRGQAVVLALRGRELRPGRDQPNPDADFILAKHRNGPTDTVTVAFHGRYSRFADIAVA